MPPSPVKRHAQSQARIFMTSPPQNATEEAATSPERVAIFADVQNLYYTTRQAYGCHFDYNAFWAAATRGRIVVQATAYAIDRGDDKQRQFQNILRAIGFEVKLKPFIQRADGSAKGDWDVGITVDVMEQAAAVQTVILLSGDGDFDVLLDRVQARHGVRTEVYGVAALTAASLIRAATRFIPIEGALLLKP